MTFHKAPKNARPAIAKVAVDTFVIVCQSQRDGMLHICSSLIHCSEADSNCKKKHQISDIWAIQICRAHAMSERRKVQWLASRRHQQQSNQSKQNSKVMFKHLQRKAVNHSVHGRQSKEETSALNLPFHIERAHICAVSCPSSSKTRRKCLHQHKTSMPLLNAGALQHS